MEQDLMRYAVRVSAEAHKAVMRFVKPGQMEYESEAYFRQLVFTDGGCRHTSYTCICGSGVNGAVLHYGHAGAPNAKQLKSGDMLMFDMGGEYACYGADISRSFPVDGKFTPAQREVYSTVLAAQDAVMKAMKPGVSWPTMHRLADRTICEKFKEYGFLTGEVDDLMKNFIGSLFMPHGLGHLLGIDTHDVGGYPNGMQRVQEPGLKSLRIGRNLEEGMILTVEPGCYFIRAVLEKALKDPVQSKFLVKEKIEKFLDFGGIRIEDDVIVTKDGIENMSRYAPRTIEEIETWMAPR
jgi:Xaa-Pro dipeptidase